MITNKSALTGLAVYVVLATAILVLTNFLNPYDPGGPVTRALLVVFVCGTFVYYGIWTLSDWKEIHIAVILVKVEVLLAAVVLLIVNMHLLL